MTRAGLDRSHAALAVRRFDDVGALLGTVVKVGSVSIWKINRA